MEMGVRSAARTHLGVLRAYGYSTLAFHLGEGEEESMPVADWLRACIHLMSSCSWFRSRIRFEAYRQADQEPARFGHVLLLLLHRRHESIGRRAILINRLLQCTMVAMPHILA